MTDQTLRFVLEVTDKGTASIKGFADATGGVDKSLVNVNKTLRQTDSAMDVVKRTVLSLVGVFSFAKIASEVKNLVVESTSLAGKYTTLGIVMESIGRNVGVGADQMHAYSGVLRSTGISMGVARQSLIEMADADINLAKATDLAKVAQNSAIIAQMGSSEAMEKLIQGLETGSVKVLRHMGIQVDFAAAEKLLAARLGKTTEELTQKEVMQARVNAVMADAEVKTGLYDVAMQTASKRLSTLTTRHLPDFKTELGKAFEPAQIILIDTATEAIKHLSDFVQDPNFRASVSGIASGFAELVKGLGSLAQTLSLPSIVSLSPILTALTLFGKKTDTYDQLKKAEKDVESLKEKLEEAQSSYAMPEYIADVAGDLKKAEARKAYLQITLDAIKADKEMTDAFAGTQKLWLDQQGKMASDKRDATLKAEKAEILAFEAQKTRFKELSNQSSKDYEDKVSKAEQWLIIQRDSGASELNVAREFYNQKNAAVWESYNQQWTAAEKLKIKEEEKDLILSALNEDYKKKLNDNSKEYLKNQVDADKKRIDSAASLYKIIDEFSDESVAAEKDSVAKKIKEYGRYVENTVALAQAQAREERQIDAKREQSRLSMYEKTKVYAKDADEIIGKLAQDEYDRAWRLTKDVNIAEKARTDFLIQENLKRAKSSDSFFDGVSAGLDDLLREQVTWGEVGTEVFSAFASSSKAALSANFQAIASGDFKNLGEAWRGVTDNMKKRFFDLVADIAFEKVLMYFKTAWAGDPSAGGKGAIESLLGVDVPFLSFAGGGEVPGMWNRKGGLAGDSIMSMLTPGEYVLPRNIAQDPMMKNFLLMIEKFGLTGLSMHAGGEVMHPELPHFGFGSFISKIFSSVGHAVGDVFGGVVDAFSKVTSFLGGSDLGRAIALIGNVALAIGTGGASIPYQLAGAAIGGGITTVQGGSPKDILYSASAGAFTSGVIGTGIDLAKGMTTVQIGDRLIKVPTSALAEGPEAGKVFLSAGSETYLASIPQKDLATVWQMTNQIGKDVYSNWATLGNAGWKSLQAFAAEPWETVQSKVANITEQQWNAIQNLPSTFWNTVSNMPEDAWKFITNFKFPQFLTNIAPHILGNLALTLAGASGPASLGEIGSRMRIGESYHDGGVIVNAQTGEGVVSRKGMVALESINDGRVSGGEPIHIHLYLDGYQIKSWLYDQSKTGGLKINERAITTI